MHILWRRGSTKLHEGKGTVALYFLMKCEIYVVPTIQTHSTTLPAFLQSASFTDSSRNSNQSFRGYDKHTETTTDRSPKVITREKEMGRRGNGGGHIRNPVIYYDYIIFLEMKLNDNVSC